MIKMTFYKNTKPQRQSRTGYEREKEMNDCPAWRLTVKYSSSPSPIMLHVCAWWWEDGRPAHCPTSLFILPFLSSYARKNRTGSAWLAERYALQILVRQHVICFIQKTHFYSGHHTFPYLFFLYWLFSQSMSMHLHVFCKLNLSGTLALRRCVPQRSSTVLFLTSTDNSFPLYPTFRGHSPPHTLLSLPTHPSLVELSPFCTRSVPIKADSPSAACPANTSQRYAHTSTQTHKELCRSPPALMHTLNCTENHN